MVGGVLREENQEKNGEIMNGNGDWEAVVYAPGEWITVMQTSIERTMEPYHDSDASNNNVADNR